MKQKMTKGQYTLLFISFITLAWFGWIRNGGDVVVREWVEQETLQVDTSLLLTRFNYMPTIRSATIKPGTEWGAIPTDKNITVTCLERFTPILNHSKLDWREIK